MKSNPKQSDTQKTTRLPIYLTHFGFFPMNANGQVGNVSAPINIEHLESDKKTILDANNSNMNRAAYSNNNIAIKNQEKNKIPGIDGPQRDKNKHISLISDKNIQMNGPGMNSHSFSNKNPPPNIGQYPQQYQNQFEGGRKSTGLQNSIGMNSKQNNFQIKKSVSMNKQYSNCKIKKQL